MHIGILQTGHAPEALIAASGDYPDMFAKLLSGHGFHFTTWSVVDGIFPQNAQAADGWLITGSKHGAYEDHDWIPPLEDLIREIHADDRPMLGICFGHQIIAQALGGKVEKFKGGWSVGRTEYQMGETSFAIHAWHQDQVTERPEGAEVLAASEFCENAVLVYGDKIWTIQPHPEFEAAYVEGLVRTRGKGVVPEPLLKQALDTLDQPNDSPAIAEEMAAFLKRGKLS